MVIVMVVRHILQLGRGGRLMDSGDLTVYLGMRQVVGVFSRVSTQLLKRSKKEFMRQLFLYSIR